MGVVGYMYGVSFGLFREDFVKPFYFTQEFWTAAATIVALFMPLLVIWLNNRPKKSNLVFEGTSIVHQDSMPEEEHVRKLLDVGRLIITNKGGNKARMVEAYIDKIISDGDEREDFFPMPIVWTHGQLNKNGPTIRDIYPNQTVYLDVFDYFLDPGYVGNSSVLFAVAAGHGVDNLSKMNSGESEILIKFYQESGQVDQVWINAHWNGKSVPEIKILNK